VRVNQVLHGPSALEGLAGAEVTVLLAEGSEVPAIGAAVTFFTDPVAFDRGIAVREVARRPAVKMKDAVMEATLAPGSVPQTFASQLHERHLRAHASEADAVVEAMVLGLEKVGGVPVREHAPDYWLARLAVSTVAKGDVPDEAVVLYINSLDVRHRTAPKPKASQRAVFLLHATDGPQRDMAPWVIPHPEDLQPEQTLQILGLSGGV
jgi:hypothetical protein